MNPIKKAVGAAVQDVKQGVAFAKSSYQRTKKVLMTPSDPSEGGKYDISRVGNQIIRTKKLKP